MQSSYNFVKIQILIDIIPTDGFLNQYGGEFANVSFFYNAMDYYRYSLNSPNETTVIFVVASDDLPWCKEAFKGKEK